MPDLEESGLPRTGLLGARNLLPDVGSGTVQVRSGFERINWSGLAGYTIVAMFPYSRLDPTTGEEQYLVVVGTTKVAAAQDNVRVVAINLETGVGTRVSPVTKVWQTPNGNHYGFVANNTFYGGAEKDPMYSWNPDAGFLNDVGSLIKPTFIADKAYDDGAVIKYTYTVASVEYTTEFQCRDGNLPDKKWNVNRTYERKDRVKHKVGSNTYVTAFKCIQGHDANVARTPGGGTNWRPFWKQVNIATPVDDDGVGHKRVWTEIPDAPVTGLAVWHPAAQRPFFRHDNINEQTVLWGSVADADNDLEWDPKDWRTGTRKDGVRSVEGAGFQPFKTGDGDKLVAFYPFGTNILIFSRRNSWVIAGVNPEGWYVRQLAPRGAAGKNAVCEHDGLVYFLSDEGFFFSDGSVAKEVPGAEVIRDYLRKAVQWEGNSDRIQLWSAGGYVWMSMSTDKDNIPDQTIVFDPGTQSFWPQSFGVNAVAVNRKGGVEQVFIAIDSIVGDHANAAYAWTGTKNDSTSTRTISAVVETNYCTAPSFEKKDVNNPNRPHGWTRTEPYIKFPRDKGSARKGNHGVTISNEGRVTDGSFDGIEHIFTVPTLADRYVSFYARRNHWKKNAAKPRVRVSVNGVENTDQEAYDYEDVGRGWWRAGFATSLPAGSNTIGTLIPSGATTQVDQVMIHDGSVFVPYFDGDGGAAEGESRVYGGGTGYVMQLGATDTDDNGSATYEATPVPWRLRTAWFPFSAGAREERRIRRIWAQIRGGDEVSLRSFVNYQPADADEPVVVTPDKESNVTFVEGLVGNIPAATSVGFEVAGEGPAAVLSVSTDTEVIRRHRFGS